MEYGDAHGRALARQFTYQGAAVAAEYFDYQMVAASQTNASLEGDVGDGGSVGDILARLVVMVNTGGATATLVISDGPNTITLHPGAGFAAAGQFFINLGIASINGPWKVTTGAGVTVVAIGLFT